MNSKSTAARGALRQRFLASASFLVLVGTFLLSACSSQVNSHKLYDIWFSEPSNPPSQSSDTYTAFATSQGTLIWTRHFYAWSSDPTPKTFLINAQLVGPFSTPDAAQRVTFSLSHPPAKPALASVKTDEWSSQTLTAPLRFPQKPGYYLLIQWTSVEKSSLFSHEYQDEGSYIKHILRILPQGS